jgi:hypothetical protein
MACGVLRTARDRRRCDEPQPRPHARKRHTRADHVPHPA